MSNMQTKSYDRDMPTESKKCQSITLNKSSIEWWNWRKKSQLKKKQKNQQTGWANQTLRPRLCERDNTIEDKPEKITKLNSKTTYYWRIKRKKY